MKAICTLIVLLCLSLTTRADRPDLNGLVTCSDGAPLSNATVFVYTAAPKHGTSSLCPSCYADCSKKAQTDAQGRFKIQSLDPSLIFRLLIVAAGYESQFAPKIDPAAGETGITLKLLSDEELNSPLRVKGLVIGENGQPLANATIGPEGVGLNSGSTQWGGSDDYVDPVAVSDDRGHFVLYCKKKVVSIFAKVDGRGVAQRWIEFKPGGDYIIRMENGVAVNGRILLQGQPLQGVSVGLSTTDRICGNYLDCPPIATDANGRFLIANVPPGREFSLAVSMDSLHGRGTIPRKVFTTGRSGTPFDLGDIAAQSGFRLEGKIKLSDGQPIPPGTLLLLSRQNVRDVSQQELGPDGSFKFSDLPPESVGLSVRIKGYKFSKHNPSLDWLNGGIVGKINDDTTGLIFLMDPGQWQFDNNPEDSPSSGNRQPSNKPLRGVK